MRFVIIGNGVAGVTAAKALAEGGSGAEVEVYTREAYHYYPRPRLQELLAGQMEIDDVYFRQPAWYEERGIAVHLGTEVREIDTAGKRIILVGGESVDYDRLLLATGGHPFIPPIKGVDKQGVYALRTLEDAKAIRERAMGAERAVVVGGGLLGLEAARALRALGIGVTVLEMAPFLLPRQLDAEGGGLLRELIGAMGIDVVVGAATQAVVGEEWATGVEMKDGERIDGDLIIISAGIRSSVDLARSAGLEVKRGVVVDEHLQTSAEDIYAAGDVAEFEGRVYGIIPAALEQARAAALNMLGEKTDYKGTIFSNTLNVVGIDCASIGTVHPEGEGYEELRSIRAGVYKKLVLEDGHLVGAILLGDTKDVAPISRLIRQKADVSAYIEDLLNEGFDWRALS